MTEAEMEIPLWTPEMVGLGPDGRLPVSPLDYPGGKSRLAHLIIPYLPREARVYVEPYAGGAWVLFRLPRPYPVEVLNDLNDNIVNVYRVLQDPQLYPRLAHRVIWTPYSRAEFARAWEALHNSQDPVERAWAMVVVCVMNYRHSDAYWNYGSWRRGVTLKKGVPTVVASWLQKMRYLQFWHQRLARVIVDKVDALECIRYWDSRETVFYIDPPYIREPGKEQLYAQDTDLAHHEALVKTLLGLKGEAVLSAYPHPVYLPLEEAGWRKVVRDTASWMVANREGIKGRGASLRKAPRREVLYISPGIAQRWPSMALE